MKHRLYAESPPAARASALATLQLALSVQLRLFAPFVPFVTEELWRTVLARKDSIHTAPWPAATEWEGIDLPASTDAFALEIEILGLIRKARTERAKTGNKNPFQDARIRIDPAKRPLIEPLLADISGFAGAPVTLADGEPGSSPVFETT